MTLEEAIIGKIRALPAEKQEEVLRFADSLEANRANLKVPLISPRGLWADLHVDVSEEDIAEMRKEAWKNFPRDDI